MKKTMIALIVLTFSIHANNITISEPYDADGGFKLQTLKIKGNTEECYMEYFSDSLEVLDTDCINLTNSKGKKIICTENKKICKTKDEINSFLKANVSQQDSLKEEDSTLENGNHIIISYDDSTLTTFAKNNMKEKYLNKYYAFSGEIYDVINRKDIVLKINSSNYVNVKFATNLPDNFLVKKKNISLKGKLSAFGTGIVFNHDIVDAVLLNDSSSNSSTTQNISRKNTSASISFPSGTYECQTFIGTTTFILKGNGRAKQIIMGITKRGNWIDKGDEALIISNDTIIEKKGNQFVIPRNGIIEDFPCIKAKKGEESVSIKNASLHKNSLVQTIQKENNKSQEEKNKDLATYKAKNFREKYSTYQDISNSMPEQASKSMLNSMITYPFQKNSQHLQKLIIEELNTMNVKIPTINE